MKTAHKSLLLMTLLGGLTAATAVLAAEGTALNANKYSAIDQIARAAMNSELAVPHGQSNGYKAIGVTAMR